MSLSQLRHKAEPTRTNSHNGPRADQPLRETATMANESSSAVEDRDIYKQLESYPWDKDRQFQVRNSPQHRPSALPRYSPTRVFFRNTQLPYKNEYN